MFNNSSVFILISGLVDIFSTFGGIGFFVYFCYYHLFDSKKEPEQKCGECKSYDVCFKLTDGCLPDFPCAYWEKKKL